MEKLDLLEQHIDKLIQEHARLREENQKLREEGSQLREDIELGQMASEDLQEQLNRERGARDAAVSRVDALLSRIQSVLTAAGEQPGN